MEEDKGVFETEEYKVIFEMEDGSLMFHADTSEWDLLPIYKKLWGKINKHYKQKFIKPVPFKAERR